MRLRRLSVRGVKQRGDVRYGTESAAAAAAAVRDAAPELLQALAANGADGHQPPFKLSGLSVPLCAQHT